MTPEWRPPAGSAEQIMADLAHLTGGRPPVLLRPGQASSAKVRNQVTGRVLPCCYADCRRDGSAHISATVPHEQPRWVNEKAGTQEMREYIFCSNAHLRAWASGNEEYQAYQASLKEG